MSEVASRPAPSRGRGSARGGRGGSRAGNRPRDRQPNTTHKEPPHFDETDQGELGEMKKRYSSQLSMLKELFPDWSDVDLLFALEDTNGDLERTIEGISEGNVSQFSDVKKNTKDRSRSKVKDASSPSEYSTRSVRGKGPSEGARGSRGKTERGRGAPRGGRAGAGTSAPRAVEVQPSIPTTESPAWGGTENTGSGAFDETTSWSKTAPAATAEPSGNTQARAGKKTWASMFAPPPKPAAAPPKSAVEPVPIQDTGAIPSSDISSGYVEVTHSDADTDGPRTASHEETPGSELPDTQDTPGIVLDESNIEIPPSKDRLTEDNVEHLPDTSEPAPTGTAASTVDSSRGPDSATPSVITHGSQQAPIGRPVMGGFATTAYKATSAQGRSASFQRRLQEQQEAVVMPGKHAVDRAAVQFGSLGLNGESALDVDEDREEAETRPQPPQHSPPAQPRASLPPPRQEAPTQEQLQTKPAGPPGLPAVPQQQSLAQGSPSNPLGAQLGQPGQTGQGYNQFGRYGQSNMGADSSAAAQKQYDPFGQQASQQSPFDGYPSQTQAPAQPQQQAQSQLGGFSSAGNDYSSYYTSDQNRNAYQNYYGTYGQQNASNQQEAGVTQQRTGSAFGAAGNDSAFPTSQSQQQQQQSRYGENQQSGHSTPNPTAGGQQQASGNQTQQHMHQQPHGQGQGQGQHGGYPYGGHPYYSSPYYTAYMNQYQYGQQGGFGGPFSKGGMYGQPHAGGYGMPQTSYDQHSSSPAMVGGFGGREAALGGGIGSEYSRSGSAQPAQGQQHSVAAAGFGNTPDVFARGQGSYPGQSQQYGQPQSGQQTSAEDSLKPFGEKASGGPSPSSIGQPGRPTSAANNTAQAGQSTLPPPQSHQQGFGGGYPSHLSGQASQQYGAGLSNLGGHQGQGGQQQSHQAGGYGNYGAGFGGNSYGGGQGGGSYGRGGWGTNYGH